MLSSPSSQSRVTAVVVTYNSQHCLGALARGLVDLPHVMIVDNASGDGTVETAKALLPQAQIIQLASNQGFGAANNVALETITTPYAFLLNPDCEIQSEQIVQLVEAADSEFPLAAILAPQILSSPSRAQINYSFPRFAWKTKTQGAEGPLSVANATGAALLLRMEAMREIGFFDPRFFLYYEDEDLCLRTFLAHQDIVIYPSVRVLHNSRSSVKGKHPYRSEYWRGYHHMQSKLLFAQKYQLRRDNRTTLVIKSVALVFARLIALSPKHLARAWGRLQGLLNSSLEVNVHG